MNKIKVENKTKNKINIKTIYKRAAGLDVHKNIVVVTIQIQDPNGDIWGETREFGTLPKDLKALVQWLQDENIENSVMESTGIYWFIVYEALEEAGLKVCVANAKHVKNALDNKTDKIDSAWLADLARCSLVRSSFVPNKQLRELRPIVRYRRKLKKVLASEKNRLHKCLDSVGIRIGNVLSSLQGSASQIIITGLIQGDSIQTIMKNVKTISVEKRNILKHMLQRPLSDSHRFLLKTIASQIAHLDAQIQILDDNIYEIMEKYYKNSWELLQTIPGIDRNSAAALIAEMGDDVSKFGSAEKLCAWAGICPGNNESAGKKKIQKCAKGIRL